MTLAVVLSDLCVRAGGTPILGPLDLAVSEGEHVLVVGPSGAGKTTLLRAICGLARVERGEVRIFGRLVTAGGRNLVEPRARGCGLLFQGGALWPHMSARRTLEFVLAQRGVPRGVRRAKADELLELVELSGFGRRRPGTLSGGEAQRLALARALACEPRVLLLDEPLGPLDAELRAELLSRLADVQRKAGLTVLHVTHDPLEAAALADRTLHMRAGCIVDDEGAAA